MSNIVMALKRNSTRLLLSIALIIFGFIAFSSWHNKSLVLEPVAVWHGAIMKAHTLLGDTSSEKLKFDKETIEELRNIKEVPLIEFQRPKLEAPTELSFSNVQVKNQVAAMEARHQRAERDANRLKEANEQILNSKRTLDGLNRDFASVAAYQKTEFARREAIAAALQSEEEIPTEEEINDLVSQRTHSSSQPSNTIPERVLMNVQQTTGISPEEINKLMNQ